MKRRNILLGAGLLTGGAMMKAASPSIADSRLKPEIPKGSPPVASPKSVPNTVMPNSMMPKSDPAMLRGKMVTIEGSDRKAHV